MEPNSPRQPDCQEATALLSHAATEASQKEGEELPSSCETKEPQKEIANTDGRAHSQNRETLARGD